LLDGCTGGSCWLEVDKKNYADVNSFLKTNVTRQECCKLEPAGEKYFSEDEPLPEQKVWIWRFLQDHKCSMACQGKQVLKEMKFTVFKPNTTVLELNTCLYVCDN